MDNMDLAVMPIDLSPELDTQLRAQAPHTKEAFNSFICNILKAGVAKALTPAGVSALETLPQLISEDATSMHVLRVEPALYTQLNYLEQTVRKKRSVLIQHFLTEGLKQEQAAIPA